MPTRAGAVPQLAARAHQVFARMPLRVKLVAAVLLLVVIALAGSGIAARATMANYLVGRVDVQLAELAHHLADGGMPPPRRPDGDERADPLHGIDYSADADATGALLPNTVNNYTGEPAPRLPHVTPHQGEDGSFFTVGAVRGDGQWRVFATAVPLRDGSIGTAFVAQRLGEVQRIVDRLTWLLLIIDASAVAIIGGVGYLLVRASLRPLREVEHTAAEIAAGDLSHRVPEADPRTEVGQLSRALNTMLTRIETAFDERAASEEAARRSEEKMRRSEAAARRSEERMRRFVADASHELRTPLTTIRGFAELYRHGAASDEDQVRRLMRRIEDEAKRMGLLVEDLLLLARLDQERPLAQDPVDLLTVVRDAVQGARAVAPDRDIVLELGPTDPPPVVIGDEARLRQVLGNLLSNALKYTPAGSPVTVGLGTGTSGQIGAPAVLVTVADEGPGLTPEAAARVFERFYRADSARNRSEGGTGLGLAIVAALVAGHGGFVDVETAPGAGASFRVELPLAEVAARSA